MATAVRWLLFLSFAAISFSVFAAALALVVGHSTALKLVHNVPVSIPPGLKPDTDVLPERVHVYGLSRMKNLEIFLHSKAVKLSYLDSSPCHPDVEVYLHRACRNFRLKPVYQQLSIPETNFSPI